jgi:hypothetical protein
MPHRPGGVIMLTAGRLPELITALRKFCLIAALLPKLSGPEFMETNNFDCARVCESLKSTGSTIAQFRCGNVVNVVDNQ